MKKLLALLILAIVACSYKPKKDEVYLFETKYPSGMLRTHYYHLGSVIWDTLSLYDSTGQLDLQGTYAKPQEKLEFKLVYRKQRDTTDRTHRDMNSINRVVVSKSREVDSVYSRFYYSTHRIQGYADFQWWIDSTGAVTHAICVENETNSPFLVFEMGSLIENWKFGSLDKADMLVVKQRFYFKLK